MLNSNFILVQIFALFLNNYLRLFKQDFIRFLHTPCICRSVCSDISRFKLGIPFSFSLKSESSFNMTDTKKMTPSDFRKQIIGRPVVVKLNSGVDYRGKLSIFGGDTDILCTGQMTIQFLVIMLLDLFQVSWLLQMVI